VGRFFPVVNRPEERHPKSMIPLFLFNYFEYITGTFFQFVFAMSALPEISRYFLTNSQTGVSA
jgi:hypothetical protein